MQETLAYAWKRLWLWPLDLWLRPIDLSDRIREAETKESLAGVLGAGVWGALIGALVWVGNGDWQAVWVLSLTLAFALLFALVFAGIGLFFELFDINTELGFSALVAAAAAAAASTQAGPIAVAGAGALAGVLAIVSASANLGTVAGAYHGLSYSTFILVIAAIGFALGTWLDTSTLSDFAHEVGGITTMLFLLIFFLDRWNRRFAPELKSPLDWSFVVFSIILVLGLPIISFSSLLRVESAQTSQWGVGLCLPVACGALVGLFLEQNEGFTVRRSKRDHRVAAEAQTAWLSLPWMLFLPLAAAAYWLGPGAAGSGARLEQLAIYLALAPVVLTGLPAWPLAALIALWQFRGRPDDNVRTVMGRLQSTIPFRWQSCAFPLPGLRGWLERLGREHGGEFALYSIQRVQLGTLQIAASRRAAQSLASDPQTALPFCGAVAIETNSVTLASLASTGPAASAVAALWSKGVKEDSLPLMLDIGLIRRRQTLVDRLAPAQVMRRSVATGPTLGRIRERPLTERIKYARDRLDKIAYGAQLDDYRQLLGSLNGLASPSEFRQWTISSRPSLPKFTPENWLVGGWRVVGDLTAALDTLGQEYRALSSEAARRRLLESRSERVRHAWDGLPDYWQGIGAELIIHWIGIFEIEARKAREWLSLAVEALTVRFVCGDQRLKLRVRNPSGEPACSVRVALESAVGIGWVHTEAGLDLLEGGKDAELGFDFHARMEGAVRIAGRLDAEDLDGNSFALPFAFQIEIAHAGRPYRKPDYQPYVTGEGLGSDWAFVGRADLIDWLRGLWLQPAGKAAVVLVGQRRIGKTSLLNKLVRDGLPGTGLLPVAINMQGVGSEYDFLSETAGRMAGLVGRPAPGLDRAEPYAAFKSFLQEVRGPLGAGRFLLMLDEADLIPERRLGDLLPGFLRALMQEPQYPTVLLFCGTTRLKAMGREDFSILFNTAQFRTVSYLSQGESVEVLEKPTRGILEYDPAVLADAWRLTRGQPLLLQLIGASVINAFNEQVRRGEERSDYVDTNDFDRAVKSVVELETNAAFENHWEDSDPPTHRVLAALAWATDETNRRQLDIDGIESAMAENRLTLPRAQTFRILERLADDEVLERDGPTYRCWVPLYRRWVAWRWPPGRMRDESIG